jgi:hypothetical protein
MRRSRINTRISIVTTAVLAMATPVAFGQIPAPSAGAQGLQHSSSAAVPGAAAVGSEIVREIDDPRNGDRWLLMRDPDRPGGPGLLRVVSSISGKTGQAGSEPAAQAPIVRAGDRVLVEENTAVAEARLEAVALGPAWQGSHFNVRLAMGGKVLRVLAAGPGRAVLEKEVER